MCAVECVEFRVPFSGASSLSGVLRKDHPCFLCAVFSRIADLQASSHAASGGRTLYFITSKFTNN